VKKQVHLKKRGGNRIFATIKLLWPFLAFISVIRFAGIVSQPWTCSRAPPRSGLSGLGVQSGNYSAPEQRRQVPNARRGERVIVARGSWSPRKGEGLLPGGGSVAEGMLHLSSSCVANAEPGTGTARKTGGSFA